MTASEDGTGTKSARLDRWIWHARIARTRTLAQAMVQAGRVRINRTRATRPGQIVRVGDILTIALGHSGSSRGRVRILRIEAVAERRGSPDVAAELFTDLTKNPDTTSNGV